ncbi:UvrD-helicase domain-containing protein [Pseudoalteromonas sp. OOF1S-7]|uniref:UvrD-helicase domain-containing protein n=1 Tax=Pseudoalteromonas sp. OOF1S-7 TaxID=2917757 RepID=UPI001EF6AFA1|nr:UvrD-helicase domain-containing protein [Pseudoalteromonas sp. OOF1S-7]MCG7536871.1 UvrD-helicase domain-containing protein [Pseudoalteromonas sp. OOF1S-7]
MHFSAHFISRVFHNVKSVEVSAQGIKILRPGHEELLPWMQQYRPPVITVDWLGARLECYKQDTVLSIRIQKYPEPQFQGQLEAFWINTHKVRLSGSITSLEQLLQRRYLSVRYWAATRSVIAELAKYWSGWQSQAGLPETLQQAQYTVTELNGWQETDLAQFREAYIQAQLSRYASFFDTVCAQPLTQAQRRACVVQDERQLLLAGAGTGKTSVMVAKAAYLLHSQQVTAEQVLMLAYGKEAAAEMQQRLSHSKVKVECATFHSLGLEIIAQAEGRKPKLSALCQNDTARAQFIAETLASLCQDPLYLRDLLVLLKRQFAETEKCEKLVLASHAAQRLIRQFSEALSFYKQALFLGKVQSLSQEFELWNSCFRPVLTDYQLYLQKEQCIDFDDMITRAIEHVRSGQFRSPWQVVLVDEFQDISPLRAALLKALLGQNNSNALFAVGDDWQAIYRFSGGDISMTTHFAEHFGEATIQQLDMTFRYPQQLLDIASEFVCQNPNQLMKRVNSSKVATCPALIARPDDENALNIAIEGFLDLTAEPCTVLLLARNHKFLPTPEAVSRLSQCFPRAQITALTFHGAKGKEADFSILLGLHKDSVPARQQSAAIIEALLPEAESYPDAEERRLFYVALTRARKQVCLLVPDEPSPFIEQTLALLD